MPRGRSMKLGRRGIQGKIPAATYSPTRKPCSTIGSGGLNFRVRDGNGWNPSDVATGKPCDSLDAPNLLVERPATDGVTEPLHMRKQCIVETAASSAALD